MKRLNAGFFIFLFLLTSQITIAEESAPPRIESDKLKQTSITAYLKENITPGHNLLYCTTFQMAWDVLTDEIVKEPIKLRGNPLIARRLNEKITGKGDLSDKYYLALAGYKRDGIEEKIITGLKEKFNDAPGVNIELEKPTDILAYAYLLKDLKFASAFEDFKYPLDFNGAAVKAFGIENYDAGKKHSELGKQVDILSYRDDNDFILGLKTTSPDDEIILAKIPPRPTLLDTVNFVMAQINRSKPSKIQNEERLEIPKMDFDLMHHFTELKNRLLLNRNFNKSPDEYYIADAIQTIRFKLNEKGALLKSEAAIYMKVTSIMISEKTRHFIFDKPFLLCLKEKTGKYPYFVMWVDNAELLLKK